MTSTKTLAVGAAAAAFLASAAPASAAVKWLTCQLYDSTKNRVVHLNGAFPMGGTVDVDQNYADFLVAAKRQGEIDETSKTEGTCIMSKSEDEALRGVAGFVKHFKAQGAKEANIGFAPS